MIDLKQLQDFAHAAGAFIGFLILLEQAVVLALSQSGLNIPMGVNMKLAATGAALIVASKVIDSVHNAAVISAQAAANTPPQSLQLPAPEPPAPV